MYYIYGLIDPVDNEIKYIGQTVNPQKRYETHLRPITLKEKWVHDLMIIDKKPSMKIIGRAGNVQRAIQKEQRLITFYESKGNKLLNGKFCSRKDEIKVNDTNIEIDSADIVVDSLKKAYEVARRLNDIDLMDSLISSLRLLGWIAIVRTAQEAIWVRTSLIIEK